MVGDWSLQQSRLICIPSQNVKPGLYLIVVLDTTYTGRMYRSSSTSVERIIPVKILLTLLVALPALLHAEIIPGNSATEEFELDLGPQGKELNRDLYGYGNLPVQENIEAGVWGAWELVYHVGRLGVDDGGRMSNCKVKQPHTGCAFYRKMGRQPGRVRYSLLLNNSMPELPP